jgi:outer membrane protein assembly factor BamD (BamD/ComL family)
LNTAKQELAKAQEISPAHPRVVNFKNTLDQREAEFLAEVKTLYEDAKADIKAEQWMKAFFNLQQVQSRFPNYEDSFQYLSQVTANGSQAYYEQALAIFTSIYGEDHPSTQTISENMNDLINELKKGE